MSSEAGTDAENTPAARWSWRVDRLLQAAISLTDELDLQTILQRIVKGAADVLDARYAALGLYDASGTITTFIHHGMDEATVEAVGTLPRGRGLLGEVIVAVGSIRLDDIADDPRSCGFPDNHPPMHSFLGVPVNRGPERYGNLYLTEKRSGEPFDADDEAFASTLAVFAAGAIESARLASTLAEVAALEARDRTRHEMLGEVINSQEVERARVSRDLHDDVGQALTSVLLGMKFVESSLDDKSFDAEDVRGRIKDLRDVVADALRSTRQLAFDLRPTVLDDIGLDAALNRLVDDFSERTGTKVELSVYGLDDHARLPAEMETVIYRIAQQSLTNIARHAQASTASVVVHADPADIRLVVEDDGIGFDTADAGSSSLGLRGMNERALLIGATLQLHSVLGEGTTVILEIPRG